MAEIKFTAGASDSKGINPHDEFVATVRSNEDFEKVYQISPQRRGTNDLYYPYNKRGVRYLGGQLTGNEKNLAIQSVCFSKKRRFKWTMGKARKWLDNNGFKGSDLKDKSFGSVMEYPTKETEVGTKIIMSDFKVVEKQTDGKVIIEGAVYPDNVDRDDEIIRPKTILQSWETTYKYNPVILYGHNRRDPTMPGRGLPVGKMLSIRLSKKWLDFTFEEEIPIGKAEVSDAEVIQLIEEDRVRAFSIGFIPKKRTTIRIDGRAVTEITVIDWLETSIVDIPSNPYSIFRMLKSYDGQGKMCSLFVEGKVRKGTAEKGTGTIETKGLDGDEKPYKNEHACRLRQPSEFKAGSFRRIQRESNGKKYSVIMGRLKDSDNMTEQAYRYNKDIWSEDSARNHCESHDGITFEPASGEQASSDTEKEVEILTEDNVTTPKEDVEDTSATVSVEEPKGEPDVSTNTDAPATEGEDANKDVDTPTDEAEGAEEPGEEPEDAIDEEKPDEGEESKTATIDDVLVGLKNISEIEEKFMSVLASKDSEIQKLKDTISEKEKAISDIKTELEKLKVRDEVAEEKSAEVKEAERRAEEAEEKLRVVETEKMIEEKASEKAVELVKVALSDLKSTRKSFLTPASVATKDSKATDLTPGEKAGANFFKDKNRG